MEGKSYTFDEGIPWKGWTPVKRYEHHTLFARKTAKGEVIFECFLNTEIERKGRRDV